MMSHLCNRRVREFLILARTWFAFGLPSKTGCDRSLCHNIYQTQGEICVTFIIAKISLDLMADYNL
jgi:hypothetical protein